MTRFDRLVRATGAPALRGEHGEPVFLFPRSGEPARFRAIVDHGPFEAFGFDGGTGPAVIVTICEDDWPRERIREDRDRMRARLQTGELATMLVTKIHSVQGGMYRVELRAG